MTIMSAGLTTLYQLVIQSEHYSRTLFGYDRCSPAGDRSSRGETCHTPCQANTDSSHHHYQCHTSERKDHLEDCGYWLVAGAETEALQYTNKDQVTIPMKNSCFQTNLGVCGAMPRGG